MDKKVINSKRLIDEIVAGNIQAFQIIIEQYERLVSHIVFRMVTNQEDREDICQEVFLKVYRHLGSFRAQSKLSTWIAKIAYNSCINYLEKKKIPLIDDIFPERESIKSFSEDTTLPDVLAEQGDIHDRLHHEIENLSVVFRTILTLYHLDEMKYSEIGEIMDMPENTVKSYLFRARKHLKDKLMTKYQKEELWH
jgi:RNA polymerase sigma factor (sigma-70 family)